MQSPVGPDVRPHAWQQHEVVEALRHFGVEVGGEQAGGREDGGWGPALGLGQEQDFLPVGEGRHDFERFWDLPRSVTTQKLPNTATSASGASSAAITIPSNVGLVARFESFTCDFFGGSGYLKMIIMVGPI